MLVLMEPSHFDIRACPIWAIPQLAELRRRLSIKFPWSATFISFNVFEGSDGDSYGRFVVNILGDNTYYGYLYKDNMTDYKHPSMAIY
jgi:hypothetical protein